MDDLCPVCGAYWECEHVSGVFSVNLAGTGPIRLSSEWPERLTADMVPAGITVTQLEAIRDEYRQRFGPPT